jgi:hypothetical protein
MGSKLEEQISGVEASAPKSDHIGFESLFKMLNIILSEKQLEQKSRLTERNIHGIIKALAWNKYLADTYGFVIEPLNKLVEDKLVYIISLDGEGRKEIIEIVRAIRAELEGHNIETVGNRLLYRRV